MDGGGGRCREGEEVLGVRLGRLGGNGDIRSLFGKAEGDRFSNTSRCPCNKNRLTLK